MKRKPTHLKILEGNPGKRPINMNEPKPAPIIPKCPAWLDAAAKKEWKRISAELDKLGLITCIDGAALAGYCLAYSRVQEAAKAIATQGTTYTTDTGFIRDRPEIAREQKYLSLMRQYLCEFGLSPSSRSKLEVKPPEGEELDPMEALLRKQEAQFKQR